MSTSSTAAMVLLIFAVGDTIGGRYILPGMLRRHPEITEQQGKTLLKLIDVCSMFFFVAAVMIYLFQPLD